MGFLRKEHICVEGIYETKEKWKSETIDKTHILKPQHKYSMVHMAILTVHFNHFAQTKQ